MRLLPLLAVAIAVPSLVACVVESRRDPPPDTVTPTPTATVPQPQQPLVVSIDTNQTMNNITGGDGVGVFVEYQAGGHWHVLMTCDTNKSGQNCNFDLKLTPDSGALTNYAVATGTANPANLAPMGQSGIEATALMTTEVADFTFDGTPGVRLTIDASVSTLHSGDFFFFVESGKINGGFTGTLSDPLTFEPTTP